MKEIIDKMIKKNTVDYEKYFNEHIHDEIYSAEYFDKFLKEFPRTNLLNIEEDVYKLIKEAKLTEKERESLVKYVNDILIKIKHEDYEKMNKVIGLLDSEFEKYLLSQLFYTGENKVKVYNIIRKLLDFRGDYVGVYKQFMDIQSIILDVIREIGLYEEENR